MKITCIIAVFVSICCGSEPGLVYLTSGKSANSEYVVSRYISTAIDSPEEMVICIKNIGTKYLGLGDDKKFSVTILDSNNAVLENVISQKPQNIGLGEISTCVVLFRFAATNDGICKLSIKYADDPLSFVIDSNIKYRKMD